MRKESPTPFEFGFGFTLGMFTASLCLTVLGFTLAFFIIGSQT
jgi:hypothetical protein